MLYNNSMSKMTPIVRDKSEYEDEFIFDSSELFLFYQFSIGRKNFPVNI